jgi:hypothetical protein
MHDKPRRNPPALYFFGVRALATFDHAEAPDAFTARTR